MLSREFNNKNYSDKSFFSFPSENEIMDNGRVIYENFRTNGIQINIYENKVINFIENNNNKHIVFLDGSILTIFNNKDERLILPNGNILFKNKNSNTFEINFSSENYSLIRYPDAFVEKIFFNGTRFIKNRSSKETLITLNNNEGYKIFNNNGRLLRLGVSNKNE